MPDVTVIVCTRGQRVKLGPCQECWVNDATRLCDGPRDPKKPWSRKIPGSDKTCSKPLCAACATRVGEKDFCREHDDPANRRLAL